MSDRIDFLLIETWEPTGRKVRTIESVDVIAERARILMVGYRRIADGGAPPQEQDSIISAAFSEYAGREMLDTELVYEISRYLRFSGWPREYCSRLACNIAFANLEEGDQFAYLDKGSV